MELNNTKFIAIIGNADYVQTAYADLKKEKGVDVIARSWFDYYHYLCRKIHVKPVRFVYYLVSICFIITHCSIKKNNVFILHGVGYLWLMDSPLYKLAKKWYSAKFVGLFWDSVDFEKYSVAEYKDKYDLIVHADLELVNKYGIKFYPHGFLSRVEFPVIVEHCDVFYCGEDGGRLPLLEKVYSKLTSLGYKCDFYCGKSSKAGETINGIKHISKMPYREYLSRMSNCRIILDLLKPGISGPSFRHNETVVYDKKNLTNNPCVRELSFFDEKQFYVFDDELYFDEQFLSTPLAAPNPHKGDVSPLKFLEFVNDKLNLQ